MLGKATHMVARKIVCAGLQACLSYSALRSKQFNGHVGISARPPASVRAEACACAYVFLRMRHTSYAAVPVTRQRKRQCCKNCITSRLAGPETKKKTAQPFSYPHPQNATADLMSYAHWESGMHSVKLSCNSTAQ